MHLISVDGSRLSVGHVGLQCGQVGCAIGCSAVGRRFGKDLLEVILHFVYGCGLAARVCKKVAPRAGWLVLCPQEGYGGGVAARGRSVEVVKPSGPFSTSGCNDVA